MTTPRRGAPRPDELAIPAILAIVLAVVALAAPGAAHAQDTGAAAADEVIEVAQDAQQTRRQTQAQLDDWAAERAALRQRWETADAQVDYLEERVQLERDRLAALENAGDELARRLEEARRLEASLDDTLLAVLGRLEDAVEGDLPFLPEERSRRLRTVRRELGDPAASPADKLRRVLEAVLIETRYGGALEVYQDRITVAGEEITADLLHVGRLGLFWLTPDEARGGQWDPAAREFTALEDEALTAVRHAVQMATRRRPVGVQDLPLGRVAP